MNVHQAHLVPGLYGADGLDAGAILVLLVFAVLNKPGEERENKPEEKLPAWATEKKKTI